MFPPSLLIAGIINGLMTGSVYALVAVGLTLVYGVLHIINFAHGALLTAAMFGAFLAFQAGIDPYVAIVPLALLDQALWLLPAIGLFFCTWALRRISRDEAAPTGRSNCSI